MNYSELEHHYSLLNEKHIGFKLSKLSLDLTRGKPSSEQLNLSNVLDGSLNGNYTSIEGIDTRNYGNIAGIPGLRSLGAELLGVNDDEVIVGGSSSLSLMYLVCLFAWQFGLNGSNSAWRKQDNIKFLCPSPGYDRHFAICEEFGIEMLTVPIDENGPEMDQVEMLVKNDPTIKGIWCVPKYSNPTGCVYSEDTIQRLAKLAHIASPEFKIFYDNAYVVHDLYENSPKLPNIMNYCGKEDTNNSVLQFSSTSKITFAGSGVSFLASSLENINAIQKHLAVFCIGQDKVNQLRHLIAIKDLRSLKKHMKKHANLLRPKFSCVLDHLKKNFENSDLAKWTSPKGGYFISLDTRPGLANEVVRLALEAGVKLTPAGATYPYGVDPDNKNIRIAPSYPTLDEINVAMEIFCNSVKLASIEQKLNKKNN
ncbi:MAG: aminotransferase [Porticoccus sp.]|jgi:DNA-binding transcriptional MocR family regulator|nr:aminotransferase [Porticoccus sp.]